jgi:hypothetical protein
MSSTRHAVIPLPSFAGAGNRPDFTPAHQVDFETGMGPAGPRTTDSRTKPSAGSERRFSVVVCDRVWLSVRILFLPNAFGWTEPSEGGIADSESPRGFAELRKIVSIFQFWAIAPAGAKMPSYSIKAQLLLAAFL